MPLSPDEQRILDEIEQRLSAEDPQLAQVVGTSTLQRHLVRRIRLAALGFGAGFLLLMSFPVSLPLAAVGFGVMLASSLVLYRALMGIGREQLRALQASGRFSLAGWLARQSERFRDDER